MGCLRLTQRQWLFGKGKDLQFIGEGDGWCWRGRKDVIYLDESFSHEAVNDENSFELGIISLVCWGVAEIPQIITNFRSKSSHGVSLIFLLTWIPGDIFNLVWCQWCRDIPNM
ncbi:hypothetical protein LXL04_000175 [Taraxacum kok-saghyz]